METMLVYDSVLERDAVQRIYKFFHQKTIVNPECTFVNGQEYLGDGVTFGSQYNKMPKTFAEFEDVLKSIKWEACLCVAGTDIQDTRRVVITYLKELRKINVHFPMAGGKLTPNEMKIYEWIKCIF